MVHELKDIFNSYQLAKTNGLTSVLVTVVALNGSSYRKPGVRMLIDSAGNMTGAVSGGCVEKEILRNAQSVFKENRALIMTYDGRYRIGCEGLLYILIEPFVPSKTVIEAFSLAITNRTKIELHSYYQPNVGTHASIGTEIIFNHKAYSVSDKSLKKDQPCYSQALPPCFRLYIVGVEHDAKHLCNQASLLGWEIVILKNLDQLQGRKEFPNALQLKSIVPDDISALQIDQYSAFVLMSHNFARDLNYLLQLSKAPAPMYIGVLGSTKRMEQLFSDLLDRKEDIQEEFMELIHGPAGIHIQAITPQEIAISIIAQVIEKQRSIPEIIPTQLQSLTHEN